MEEPRKRGQPKKETTAKKKRRSMSFTDSEWQHLEDQAKAAGAKNPSQFIVKRLKLK